MVERSRVCGGPSTNAGETTAGKALQVVRVSRLTAAERGAVVKIHIEAFSSFFLGRMGPRFLAGFYDAIDRFPGGIIVLARDGDGIQGFAAGFKPPTLFYRYLKSQWRRLLVGIVAGVLRDPGVVPQVIGNQLRVRRTAAAGQGDEGACELASIAVLPNASGRGIGQELVAEFCASARSAGSHEVILTTDRDGNDRARRFYEALGFEAVRKFTRGRTRIMVEYRRAVDTDRAGGAS